MNVEGGAAISEPKVELLVEVIAGPETAARLGVPVGSIVETRQVDGQLTGNVSYDLEEGEG